MKKYFSFVYIYFLSSCLVAEEYIPCKEDNIIYGVYDDLSVGKMIGLHYPFEYVFLSEEYVRKFEILTNRISYFLGVDSCNVHSSYEPHYKISFVRRPLVISESKRVKEGVVNNRYKYGWEKEKNDSEKKGYDLIDPAPYIIPDYEDYSCKLISPWLKVIVQKKSKLEINAVFTLSDRQVIIDQAYFNGVEGVLNISPRSLYANIENRKYELDYLKAYKKRNLRNDELLKELNHIPKDILWAYYVQSKVKAPSGNQDPLRYVLDKSYEGYLNFLLSLFMKCVNHEGENDFFHFKNIKQVESFISTDGYGVLFNKGN